MTKSADQSQFENPMKRLARALGETEHPVPPSDQWIKVVLTVAPCTVLILISMLWEWGAQFLLVFAGAFASIQLVQPYERAANLVKDHLTEARQNRRSGLKEARIKLEVQTSSMVNQGLAPVGYSPAGLALARRRFRRLSRRWQRSFIDMNGRGSRPDTFGLSPAAVQHWLYPSRRPRFRYKEYLKFVAHGRNILTRFSRVLIGWIPLLGSYLMFKWLDTETSKNRQQHRAENLLQKVGLELIRATNRADGDETVRTLAGQLDLCYERPKFKNHWVLRENELPTWRDNLRKEAAEDSDEESSE